MGKDRKLAIPAALEQVAKRSDQSNIPRPERQTTFISSMRLETEHGFLPIFHPQKDQGALTCFLNLRPEEFQLVTLFLLDAEHFGQKCFVVLRSWLSVSITLEEFGEPRAVPFFLKAPGGN